MQPDDYTSADSSTLCPLSAVAKSDPAFRVRIQPASQNGLLAPSVAMGDMITTVRQSRLGRRIGHLDPGDMARVEVAVAEFLGISRRSV